MKTLALWRFDDTVDAVRPRDEMGNVDDLDLGTPPLHRPLVIDAALGRGRRFLASDGRGYVAQDKISGTTLLQRDMSVQVVLQWNLAAQAAAGTTGIIYCRGKDAPAAEYVSAAVELRVVNAAANAGEIRFWWQDSTGAEKDQLGGQFSPSTTDFILLTATRRWISTTRVVVKYYLGDQLLSESESADGDIAGGTTGTTQIGAGFAFTAFFDGVIDELRVVDYELAPEEIAATYRRITIEQPGCYALLRELHDPGFPISQDPASRVQRETRQIGHGLGFASAQAQNAADNLLPDHAYGNALVRQEALVGVSPKAGDSLEKRRARALTRWAELGATDAGVKAELAEPLDTAAANLQIIGQNCDTLDDGTSLNNTSRWFYEIPGVWSVVAGAIQTSCAAAQVPFDGTQRLWQTARMAIDGTPHPGYGFRGMAKITPSVFGANGEAGIFLGNMGTGNYLLVSLKYSSAGFVNIATEFFVGWASQGQTIQTVAPIAWATGWLRVILRDDVGVGITLFGQSFFRVEWSTVAEAGPYASVAFGSPANWFARQEPALGPGVSVPHGATLFGLFLRSTGGGATTATVGFQNIRTRSPHGARAMSYVVYRDPALPGAPDFDAAQVALSALKQAHTVGTVSASKKMLCGDQYSLCGRTPLA